MNPTAFETKGKETEREVAMRAWDDFDGHDRRQIHGGFRDIEETFENLCCRSNLPALIRAYELYLFATQSQKTLRKRKELRTPAAKAKTTRRMFRQKKMVVACVYRALEESGTGFSLERIVAACPGKNIVTAKTVSSCLWYLRPHLGRRVDRKIPSKDSMPSSCSRA